MARIESLIKINKNLFRKSVFKKRFEYRYSLNLKQLEFLLITISDSILAMNQSFFTSKSVKLIDSLVKNN